MGLDLGRHRLIAPRAAAVIQLYSRLWLELEALCNSMCGGAALGGIVVACAGGMGSGGMGARGMGGGGMCGAGGADGAARGQGPIGKDAHTRLPQRTEAQVRLEIIRLELVLLREACDCARWRALLGREQLAALRADLDAIMESLDAPGGALGLDEIFSAQNRLFDAVLDQYSQGLQEATQAHPQRTAIGPWATALVPHGALLTGSQRRRAIEAPGAPQ